MIDMKKFISLAILIMLIVPASIVAVRSESGSGTKPSIVLIHGAWADGSGWSGVISRLQDQGYTVYAPSNPLRSLASDSAYIADFLQSISGPIILVGHSYGGAVITNAATGNPNVKALVYVYAFVPDQGESLIQLLSMPPPIGQSASCLGGDPSKVFNFVNYPGAAAGDFDVYIKQSSSRLASQMINQSTKLPSWHLRSVLRFSAYYPPCQEYPLGSRFPAGTC